MDDRGISQRLEAAIAAAREGGEIARAAFQARPAGAALTFKGHQDYITETDGRVEELVRSRLLKAFPADAFFGEESGGTVGDDVWVVDPIDGTSNFARGIPHFAVSIAFVSRGRIEIGVVYNVMLDELYVAARGRGATRNGRPLKVSGCTDLRQAAVEAGWSPRVPLERYLALFAALMHTGAGVRSSGSGTLGLCYVADGRLDGYCEQHINSWDVLAGLLLIAEAGGWVNDFLANDGLRQGNRVLACTPALRDELAAVMRGVASESDPLAG